MECFPFIPAGHIATARDLRNADEIKESRKTKGTQALLRPIMLQ